MKILRVRLENFLGIKHGMGKHEIEIDLSKSVNNIVMLLGRNGSGKSTIMSQLHPFKDSFDDRKDLICFGCDGRKEIDYEHNGIIYKIVHIYSKIAQSFITKDGVELNESGGVKTCEDIIRRELGLTKDFFKIGKVGSNTKNFVGFTAAERKNYIGTFLNIDDYSLAFKNVKEKYNNTKKSISDITDRLKQLENIDVLKNKLVLLQEKAREIFKRISDLHVQEGQVRTTLSSANNIIANNNIELVSLSLNKEKELRKIYSDCINNYSAKYPDIHNVDELIEECKRKIATLNGDIRVLTSELSNNNILNTDYSNRANSIQIQLNNIGSAADLEKINADIADLDEKIVECKQNIVNNPQSTLVRGLFGEKKDINRTVLQFVEFSNYIEKYFSEFAKCDFTNSKLNVEYFIDSDFKESFERQLYESARTVSEKEKLIDELKEELRSL